nr:MAG TPA: hypothetical protein [Caudoviricetes sp.]
MIWQITAGLNPAFFASAQSAPAARGIFRQPETSYNIVYQNIFETTLQKRKDTTWQTAASPS